MSEVNAARAAISRRRFLQVATAGVGLSLLMACSSAPPTPTAAPAKPTEAPAKPTSAPAAAASPAGAPAAAAKPATAASPAAGASPAASPSPAAAAPPSAPAAAAKPAAPTGPVADQWIVALTEEPTSFDAAVSTYTFSNVMVETHMLENLAGC